jgi:hypothetical protein
VPAFADTTGDTGLSPPLPLFGTVVGFGFFVNIGGTVAVGLLPMFSLLLQDFALFSSTLGVSCVIKFKST